MIAIPLRRLALLCALAAALAGVVVVGPADADLGSRIGAKQSRAEYLRGAVAQESAKIRRTEQGLARAQRRLAVLRASAAREQARLDAIQDRLRAARIRLTKLERRLQASFDALRKNLNQAYRTPAPDVVSVVMNAKGFSDLLESADFYKRIARQNARIMDAARTTKHEVERQANRLVSMQAASRKVADRVQRRRDGMAAIQQALLERRADSLKGRSARSAELQDVNGQLASLRKRQQAAIAKANQAPGAPSGGTLEPPKDAPAAVARVVAAANAIAGLPYVYGGGHGSFRANAYDCSGSVSYALAAAGLVSAPMASGGFMSWGEPGPGKHITTYANAGHMFMVVDGRRYDTSALREGGSRWSSSLRPTAGFVARHPPGL